MNYQLSFQPESFAGNTEVGDFEMFETAAFEQLQGMTSSSSLQRVRWIQKSLNNIMGFQLKIDGIMGPLTRSAVRSFQQRWGLVVDGIVGINTENALRAAGRQPLVPYAPPGYTTSLTRRRFENAVAHNDWSDAFLNLNGLNMYEMLRSLENLTQKSRTQLMSQKESFRHIVNMARIEYAMEVVQFRKLPPIAPGDLAATGQVQTAIEFLQTPKHVPVTCNPFQVAFEQAAQYIRVPASWATNPALCQLVKHESAWNPKAKNPSSTAFGLFQFLKSTWARQLPEVPYGNTDPYWQAVGGFRYIQTAYRTPERAWAFWQATVLKNPSLAPPDLRGKAQQWISKGWAGYEI